MGWGDEIMAAGDARRVMETDSRRVEIVDRFGARRWHLAWKGNPRIARPGEVGDFQQVVNGSNARPYHTGKSAERWFYNLAYRVTPAELFFTDEELAFADRYRGRVIIEPNVKANASPNKQWGAARWESLAALLKKEMIPVAQMGPIGTRFLAGVEPITTESFKTACAVLSVSLAATLPEGGLHHASAAVGLPAVVIFGGFTPVEVTGYDLHVNLGVYGREACGSRVPCNHCVKVMNSITPEMVVEKLMGVL